MTDELRLALGSYLLSFSRLESIALPSIAAILVAGPDHFADAAGVQIQRRALHISRATPYAQLVDHIGQLGSDLASQIQDSELRALILSTWKKLRGDLHKENERRRDIVHRAYRSGDPWGRLAADPDQFAQELKTGYPGSLTRAHELISTMDTPVPTLETINAGVRRCDGLIARLETAELVTRWCCGQQHRDALTHLLTGRPAEVARLLREANIKWPDFAVLFMKAMPLAGDPEGPHHA